MRTLAERRTIQHFKLKLQRKDESMSWEDMARIAKERDKFKAQRTALLEAAKTALFCAELEIKLNNKPWEGPAKQLREAIALAEKE